MEGGWKPTRVKYYAGKTAAPAITDDANSGFVVSDIWIDETNDRVYELVDATVGVAVWVQIAGAGQSHDSLADVSADDHHAQSHSVTSHSDVVDATGENLEELTGAGETALHIHDDRYYTETELGLTTANYTSGADKIGTPCIGSPTFSTLGQILDLINSAGRATGGTIVAGSAANTVKVEAGTGFIKATDSDTAELLSFDWAESGDLSVPSGTTRYIGIVYGDPPVADVRTGGTHNLDSEFPLGTVVNEGGTLHIHNNPWWTTDGMTNLIERFQAQGNLVRDEYVGGLVLSVTATRRVVVSGGTLWSRVNEFPFTAFTSVDDAGTFEAYYVDSLGVWRDADLTQYRVDKYNNTAISGTGALADILANRYVNLWVYIEADDDEVAIVYGKAQYTVLATAEAEAPPTSIPPHISAHGILIGRILIKQGVDAPVEVQTVWTTVFSAAQAANHANLSNLNWSTSGHTIDGDIAMGTNKLTGLAVPSTAGDSIRATAKITEAVLESMTDLFNAGTVTGDIIRYNSVSGAWEVSAEPLSFKQINLTPAAAAILDIEGGMWYKSTEKCVYVCTDI